MSQTTTYDPTRAAEVAAYTAGILAALGSREPREVLHETPETLRRAVAGLTPEQLTRPEAPGKWSVLHVVQHLADSELVGAYRFRMVLAHDRPLLPGYDQDLWADRLRYAETDLATALEVFALLRRINLGLVEGLPAADLERVMRHAERGEESIARMLSLYAGHDRVHLSQIERIKRAVAAG